MIRTETKRLVILLRSADLGWDWICATFLSFHTEILTYPLVRFPTLFPTFSQGAIERFSGACKSKMFYGEASKGRPEKP